MAKTPISDDKFFKKYEAYEKESLEDFIKRYSSTEKELRETIACLIRHRKMMRDDELKNLEAETQSLVEKLKETNLKESAKRFRVGACTASVFANEISTGEGKASVKSVTLQKPTRTRTASFRTPRASKPMTSQRRFWL